MPDTTVSDISNRALEVFVSLSGTGSLQDTARALGISAPAASQQLKNLETVLGYSLIDHARRPLEPTRAGHTYLAHACEALAQLRQGAIAVALNDLVGLRRLRLGVIDDFDSDVSPHLVAALVGTLPQCELTLLTAPSHLILEELAAGSLDFGIAVRPPESLPDVVEVPLLRDPFVKKKKKKKKKK